MRVVITLCILFTCVFIGTAQYSLQNTLNMPRPGDELIKYQVSYKDPGRSGENVLWDFSLLHVENETYHLRYIEGKDSVVIGQEHFTQYYYVAKNDTLALLRHENPTVKLSNTPAIPLMIFPMAFGQRINANYQSEGFYSRTVPMETYGNVTVMADAYGKLLLPSGDTLFHVLRTKTTQLIIEKNKGYDNDSLKEDSGKWQDIYRWYAPGYRYPVFETIIHRTLKDSTEVFSTAFFYPPQDHYYLEEDEANQRVLDQIKKDNNDLNNDPWADLTYNFYPNPVITDLEIEIYLPRPASIKIQLTERSGRVVMVSNLGTKQEGVFNQKISMSHIPPSEYVLNILLDDSYMLSETIFKR